jgi:hypothetical protein
MLFQGQVRCRLVDALCTTGCTAQQQQAVAELCCLLSAPVPATGVKCGCSRRTVQLTRLPSFWETQHWSGVQQRVDLQHLVPRADGQQPVVCATSGFLRV